VIEIESVLVVVAASHGAGTAPNHSSPPTTTSVASASVSIEAVTTLVPALYEHDSACATAALTGEPAAASKPVAVSANASNQKRRAYARPCRSAML
jgi:hypothetical protein